MKKKTITATLALNKTSCNTVNFSAPCHAFMFPVLMAQRSVVSNARLTLLLLLLWKLLLHVTIFAYFSLLCQIPIIQTGRKDMGRGYYSEAGLKTTPLIGKPKEIPSPPTILSLYPLTAVGRVGGGHSMQHQELAGGFMKPGLISKTTPDSSCTF